MPQPLKFLLALLFSLTGLSGAVITCSITDLQTGRVLVTEADSPTCSSPLSGSGVVDRSEFRLSTYVGMVNAALISTYGHLDVTWDQTYEPSFLYGYNASAAASQTRRMRGLLTSESGASEACLIGDDEWVSLSDELQFPWEANIRIRIQQGNGPLRDVTPPGVPVEFDRPFYLLVEYSFLASGAGNNSFGGGVGLSARKDVVFRSVDTEEYTGRIVYLVDIPEPQAHSLIATGLAWLTALALRQARSRR